jgi:hypothetical protein
MTEQPDLNTGKEWSKKDLFSLRNRIERLARGQWSLS